MFDNQVSYTGDGRSAPPEVRKFAERMLKQHDCPVKLTLERSGYHLYLPCPACLEDHGKKELADPKYAINVSKHLGLGDYKNLLAVNPYDMQSSMDNEKLRDNRVGVCMRTRQSAKPHFFPVNDLLSMPTVTERHADILTRANLVTSAGSSEREENWELDERSGKKCPPPPGKVMPIFLLPPEHPAVQYLVKRGYDLKKLWQQFRCSFCVEEWPEGHNGIYYRKMPGGWKDTSQHRIIFYAMVDGAPMSWQARYPEMISDDGLNRYMLHPYYDADRSYDPQAHEKLGLLVQSGHSYGWSHTHTRANAHSAWIPVRPFDQTDANGSLRFQPSKYRTARYASRELLGWDTALQRAAEDSNPLKWIVLCEGPLDAARVGPGGVALLGSSINADNAAKIVSRFQIVITAFDEDDAGKGATANVCKMLRSNPNRNSALVEVTPLPIPSGKDIGEMEQQAFDALLEKTLRKAMRGL